MALSVDLVALPIGNVEDLSSRALAALRSADRIFCEDTRKLRELLTRAKVETNARFTPLPGDREHEFDWAAALHESKGQTRWALVSDAGTPVVNDPGAGLLEFCRRESIEVRAIPGPCAPVAAWQWSGGFGVPFAFAGFAPKVKTLGVKELVEFFAPLAWSRTFSFFDTRHQFTTTLKHLIEAGQGERRAFVAREMTKPHEELVVGTVAEVCAALEKRLIETDALGELTILIEGDGTVGGVVGDKVPLEQLTIIRGGAPKEAARVASTLTGLSVKECYDALNAKGRRSES